MDEDETNDLLEGEIDNVEPSDDDDPEFIDEADPSEDDGDTETDEGTEDETDEAEAEDEAEDQEAEGEPEAAEIADDVLVKMADGTTVTLRELKDSPMLKADHTRKTQEIATQRESVKADAERIEGITQAFVDHLTALIPDEPNPSLALTNPDQYTGQKAQYEAAVAQVQKLIEIGSQPKEVTSKLSEEDQANHNRAEYQKLVAAVPEAVDPKVREQMFADVREVANRVGFADADLKDMNDHRFFLLARMAKKGLEAETAKTKAKAKAAKAPPVAAKKPGQGTNVKGDKSRKMQRLMKDDSIENAVAFLIDD
jgi:hypothetical protein